MLKEHFKKTNGYSAGTKAEGASASVNTSETRGAAISAAGTVAVGAAASANTSETRRAAASAAKPHVPDGMFRKCGSCKKILYEEDIRENWYCCPECGRHFRIGPWERIGLTADSDSFEEWDAGMIGTDPLQFPDYPGKLEALREKTGLDDAVITGCCTIRGIRTAIGVMSPDFLMGSMGTAVGERITRMTERATRERLPVVLFCCSGGARMQEGIFSLMQMAKTSQALKRLDEEGLLYVSVLTDPTMGGVTASFAMLGDIILAEPGALVGFAGARVIRQTIGQKLPEGFQSAEFLVKHGFADRIVRREQMRRTLATILRSAEPTGHRPDMSAGFEAGNHRTDPPAAPEAWNRRMNLPEGFEAEPGRADTSAGFAPEIPQEALREIPGESWSEPARSVRSDAEKEEQVTPEPARNIQSDAAKEKQATPEPARSVRSDAEREEQVTPEPARNIQSDAGEEEQAATESARSVQADAGDERADAGTKDCADGGPDTKTAWERVLLARSGDRPFTADYLAGIFDGFLELRGDRLFGDDRAVIGGLAVLDGRYVTVIGQQKGRNTKENRHRNFGMPNPEGYRKALRLMKQAEKFGRPVILFVDTPGAFCGVEAEERGQGEAIARNLFEMSGLRVPVLTIVIGEGGSGGALAFAVANEVWMMENAVYSVLSPEGFAAILWKDGKRAPEAAGVMRMTAARLKEAGIIEKVIPEPEPARRDSMDALTGMLRQEILQFLERFGRMTEEQIVEARYQRFRSIGEVKSISDTGEEDAG